MLRLVAVQPPRVIYAHVMFCVFDFLVHTPCTNIPGSPHRHFWINCYFLEQARTTFQRLRHDSLPLKIYIYFVFTIYYYNIYMYLLCKAILFLYSGSARDLTGRNATPSIVSWMRSTNKIAAQYNHSNQSLNRNRYFPCCCLAYLSIKCALCANVVILYPE